MNQLHRFPQPTLALPAAPGRHAALFALWHQNALAARACARPRPTLDAAAAQALQAGALASWPRRPSQRRIWRLRKNRRG